MPYDRIDAASAVNCSVRFCYVWALFECNKESGFMVFIDKGMVMKTTKAEFNQFKKAFMEYVELFGLKR